MGYIAADDILKAREMDLMTYLRNYEPQSLFVYPATPTAHANTSRSESATGNGTGFRMTLEGDPRLII